MGGGEALFFCFFPLCFFPFWVFTFFRVSSSSNNGLSKTPFRLNQIVKGEVVLRREEVGAPVAKSKWMVLQLFNLLQHVPFQQKKFMVFLNFM